MLVDLQPYNGAEENLHQVKDMFTTNWVAELELSILLSPVSYCAPVPQPLGREEQDQLHHQCVAGEQGVPEHFEPWAIKGLRVSLNTSSIAVQDKQCCLHI